MVLPAGRGALDYGFEGPSEPLLTHEPEIESNLPIQIVTMRVRPCCPHPFSGLVLAAGTVRFVLTAGRDMARDVLGIMPDTPNER